ncbi:MAG TPA: adenylate/guanylate cyclase domain-containing protein [bacterium]|jgi:class 3 adenylate cyclase/tetratricopeptide (TPR) repeat protein|nr:adenylate/guanylate cyclase domain-containing protein [bacterium]
MVESLHAQLEALRHSIAVLEAQRATLGDAVVEPAIDGLRQRLTALETQTPLVVRPAEERRLITIFFIDVVGSTALAEQQDPEEWRQTVARLHSTVGLIVQQHQGNVAQYLGDGLLALFGAHHASEHDPENAIRAALAVQAAIPTMDGAHPIQVRVGIHTGLVVVGALGSDAKREFTATGDAMNLAARLQSAAPSAGILISNDTYRYVRGVFNVTPQPPLTLKGKQEPVQTYLVRAAKPRPFRTVTRGVAGIQTRTVGREAELTQLQTAYLEAFEQGRVVWAQLVGEAGIGKSRLLDDIRDWIELRPEVVRLHKARAYVGDARQPFALIRRMWFDRFQIAEDAPLRQAEAKWVRGFQELAGIDDVEPAHALGLLVGLPFDESPYISAMRDDPVQVKGRAFVVSREFLKKIREQSPVEILLEDLQWADESSWEYLTEVMLESSEPVEGLQGMFICAAARPEWNPPKALTDRSTYHPIELAPLSDEATRELILELVQRVEAVPDDVVELVVERSEGMPYYAEEMVNWFFDRGIIDQSREPWRFVPARLKESPLPATLQHLLLTRLSVLSDGERAALQRGAVFGRNFWAGGLEALGVRHPDVMLRPLQPRGFVEPQPESSFEGDTEWSFHHALLRDVTYESVLRRERTALHKAAAAWLEAQARRAGRLDEFSGLLGEHAERAGEMSAAADWYLQAGDRAKGRGATAEARRFFDRALELLPPIDKERRWRGLLGRTEALEILGEPDEQRADVATLLSLAEELDDENRLAEAYVRQADYAGQMGDYPAALRAAELAVAAARRAGNTSIEVRALSGKVVAQTRVGDMAAAERTAEEVLARAREAGDETALALAMSRAAIYYNESGDLGRSQELERESIDLAHRLGYRQREARGLGNYGYGLVILGLYKQARIYLERALQLDEATGARRGRAFNLQNLGLVSFRTGDGRAARRLLEESLHDMTAVGDAWGRAATLQYLALVLEQTGDLSGAARRFEEAQSVFARSSHAWAMDALAGIARCALAQGRLDEARRHATDLWTYLAETGPKGIEHPVWAYLTCADIFDALGQREQARAAVESGYRELMERAEKISNPEWRKSFLENVPEHRSIVEMWEHANP